MSEVRERYIVTIAESYSSRAEKGKDDEPKCFLVADVLDKRIKYGVRYTASASTEKRYPFFPEVGDIIECWPNDGEERKIPTAYLSNEGVDASEAGIGHIIYESVEVNRFCMYDAFFNMTGIVKDFYRIEL